MLVKIIFTFAHDKIIISLRKMKVDLLYGLAGATAGFSIGYILFNSIKNRKIV